MPHPSQFCLDLKPYLSPPKLVHCYLGKSLTPDFTIMLSYFKFAFLGCTGPNSWVALTAATLKNAPQCTLKYCALEARKKHWQIVAFLRKKSGKHLQWQCPSKDLTVCEKVCRRPVVFPTDGHLDPLSVTPASPFKSPYSDYNMPIYLLLVCVNSVFPSNQQWVGTPCLFPPS